MSKFRQAAEELVRIMPALLQDGTLNNADTIEAKLVQFIGTNVGCIYCGASYDLSKQRDELMMHIVTCAKSPLVQTIQEMQAALRPSHDFLLKVEELIKERAIAVDNLTRTQLADAICQAIQCGDFHRHLVRGEDRQQVVYVPFQREHELKARIAELEARIANALI